MVNLNVGDRWLLLSLKINYCEISLNPTSSRQSELLLSSFVSSYRKQSMSLEQPENVIIILSRKRHHV